MTNPAPQSRTPHLRLGVYATCMVGIFLLWIGLGGCSLSGVTGGAPTVTPTETALPTQPPGPTATPDASRDDDIVYIRKYIYGLSGDVYLVHSDALSPRQITNLTRDQASAASDQPVWSPDHKSVAFASEYRDLYNKAIWNLYVTDPAGKGAQQITGLPQPNNGYFPTVPLTGTVPGVSVWAVATPPPGGTVTGRVIDTTGKPVSGTLVVSWLGSGFTQTDAAGHYTLDDVPAGTGWIKATSDVGAGWVDVSASLDKTTEAPDITLDPTLINASYILPGWDLDGKGLWMVYSRYWFDPGNKEPRYEQALAHVNIDGSDLRELYQAQGITLGRPRVRPNHPDQVALVDGTDLVLLTVDTAGGTTKSRQVLAADAQREGNVSWSPDGETIYYSRIADSERVSITTLQIATGAVKDVVTYVYKVQYPAGFDTSPDGDAIVYEREGDLYVFYPVLNQIRHLTFYGSSSYPSWSGR